MNFLLILLLLTLVEMLKRVSDSTVVSRIQVRRSDRQQRRVCLDGFEDVDLVVRFLKNWPVVIHIHNGHLDLLHSVGVD